MNFKKTTAFLGSIIFGSFWANVANAVCPVCVVAIGAGLGLSEWLGIDDVISSFWIGAFLFATVLWTLTEMRKRGWKFYFDGFIIFCTYYALTFIPLYYAGILGHPLNKIFGIDKIIFGTAVGTFLLFLGHKLHEYLKHRNNEKSFFPYQKVVIPVVLLILLSIIFYFILR